MTHVFLSEIGAPLQGAPLIIGGARAPPGAATGVTLSTECGSRYFFAFLVPGRCLDFLIVQVLGLLPRIPTKI